MVDSSSVLYLGDVAGSMALYKFLLLMLLLLGGSLPVVFWKKRKHTARGLL